MRDSAAAFFIAAALAAIAPVAACGQQKLMFSVEDPGGASVAEVRVDPAVPDAASVQPRLADHLLMQAIDTADRLTAERLLASEFTWIDRDGRSRSKSDVVDRIALLSAGPDANLTVHVYGRVALLTGTHALTPDSAEAFFTRVWVRQASGWRLLVYQETAPGDFSAKDAGYGIPRPPANCDNPCSSLPYKPLSPAAQEIVTSFMAGEKALFEGDAESAGRVLADDALLITPDGYAPIGKTQRIAGIRNLRQADPPPAVASMAVWVFGEAAVMSADQESWLGQFLRTTGIWARRAAGWQLIFSQQTEVQ